MDNSQKIEKASVVITIIIVLLCLVGIWFMISNLTPIQTVEVKAKKAEVNTKLYQQITNPNDSANNLSPDEPGYGRINPFDPYK